MGKKIEGVPEFIWREDYVALFERLGIDPHRTTAVRLLPDGVRAEVYALGDDGKPVVDGNELVRDHVYIPVRDSVEDDL